MEDSGVYSSEFVNTNVDFKKKIKVRGTKKQPTQPLPQHILNKYKSFKIYTTSVSTLDRNNHELRLHDRVVFDSKSGRRTGRVRYIGKTAFAYDQWVGVELEGPFGKNDGSVDGIRYFTCPMKYGIFVPNTKVTVVKGEH